jgi:hypothetical protein
MPVDIAGGHLDRGGAGIAGERGRRPEPTYITDSAEDLAGVDRPDAVELGECAARGRDGRLGIAGCFGDAAIERTDFTDKPRVHETLGWFTLMHFADY